eukprot:gene37084-45013_t
MFVANFFLLCLMLFAGVVAAKNNFFVMTYFKVGGNCSTGASGKTQEQYQMNICTDAMQKYVEVTPGFVSKQVFSDYKCTALKSSTVYELSVCQRYDAYNDIYPTAY